MLTLKLTDLLCIGCFLWWPLTWGQMKPTVQRSYNSKFKTLIPSFSITQLAFNISFIWLSSIALDWSPANLMCMLRLAIHGVVGLMQPKSNPCGQLFMGLKGQKWPPDPFLLEVFMTALVKKIPASLVEAIQQAHDGQFVFQDDDDDDRERYRMQVGKWTLDAVEALQKPEFWAVLLVSHTSRGPITHAMAWIMKSNKTSSQNIDSVVGFVTEAVPKIEKEFATLLNSGDQWSDLLSFISEFGLCESYWLNKAVFHVCSTAANFAKRISFRCAAYPMKLAWMVCSQPTQNCRHRQQIAKEILDMLGLSNGTVQASKASKSSVPDEAWARETLKVCKWLEQDFVQAATNGSWSDQAHYAITCLVGSLHLDTQKIEGLNSTIKMVCQVAPNIHLPLLSARMNIKHSLSQIQSTRDQRQQIIDYAIDTHTATRHWIKAIEDDGAMSKQQRWVPIGLSSSCDAFAPPQPQVLQPAGSDAVTREAGAAEGVNSGDKGQSASSQAPKPRKRTGVKNNNSPNSPNSHLCIHPVLSSYKYDIV